MEPVQIVEILPTKLWAERDIFGTIHIKCQHEGHKVFDFVQIQYSYEYTSNHHSRELAQAILDMLGGGENRV